MDVEEAKAVVENKRQTTRVRPCLLYTSDAADEEDSVELGGSRIIEKKNTKKKKK